jgi:hypothetical protein
MQFSTYAYAKTRVSSTTSQICRNEKKKFCGRCLRKDHASVRCLHILYHSTLYCAT